MMRYSVIAYLTAVSSHTDVGSAVSLSDKSIVPVATDAWSSTNLHGGDKDMVQVIVLGTHMYGVTLSDKAYHKTVGATVYNGITAKQHHMMVNVLCCWQ
jgi:hypothetical protein